MILQMFVTKRYVRALSILSKFKSNLKVNKNITQLTITAALFFVFSCKQTQPKAIENGLLNAKTPVASASVISQVLAVDSVYPLQHKSHSKMRSCCVGAPSRFKTNALASKTK
jgi:hypothetical protein